MASRIIKTPPTWPEWWQTAPGQYLWDWECAQFDTAVANLFGYHALQLGMPELDTLRANRIPHRWLALDTPPATMPVDGLNPVLAERLALRTNFAALPFPEACLDLVVLPHTLERNADPHATLREVARVLVPEGRVVLSGFNPISLWGLRQSSAQRLQRRGWGELYLPDCPHALTHHRLHDWLQLLDLEVEVSHFGGYRPAVRGEPWLRRWAWMDEVGRRWWPILGAVYLVVAVKRVHGMRLYKPGWTQPLMRGAAVAPLTRYHRPSLSSPEEPLEPR